MRSLRLLRAQKQTLFLLRRRRSARWSNSRSPTPRLPNDRNQSRRRKRRARCGGGWWIGGSGEDVGCNGQRSSGWSSSAKMAAELRSLTARFCHALPHFISAFLFTPYTLSTTSRLDITRLHELLNSCSNRYRGYTCFTDLPTHVLNGRLATRKLAAASCLPVRDSTQRRAPPRQRRRFA